MGGPDPSWSRMSSSRQFSMGGRSFAPYPDQHFGSFSSASSGPSMLGPYRSLMAPPPDGPPPYGSSHPNSGMYPSRQLPGGFGAMPLLPPAARQRSGAGKGKNQKGLSKKTALLRQPLINRPILRAPMGGMPLPMGLMPLPPARGGRAGKRGGPAMTALMARSALQAARFGAKKGGVASKAQALRKSATYMKKRDEKRKAYRDKMMTWRKLLFANYFFIPFEEKKSFRDAKEKEKKGDTADKEEEEKMEQEDEEKEEKEKNEGEEEVQEKQGEVADESATELKTTTEEQESGVKETAAPDVTAVDAEDESSKKMDDSTIPAAPVTPVASPNKARRGRRGGKK